jgi:hypothetical protein
MALQLTAGRTLIAGALFAAPVVSTRFLGADTATARRVVWLTRMTAIRDGAIGAGGLAAVRRGADPVPWLVAGAVSDAVDAVVLAQAWKQGRIKGPAPAAVVPLGALAAAAGAVAAVRLRRG